MLEQIPNVPGGILAFYCKGPVLESDLREMVWPVIHSHNETQEELNFLVVLVTPQRDMVSLILWMELMAYLQTENWCKRFGLLADAESVVKADSVLSTITNTKYKGFFLQQFPDAIYWLQGKQVTEFATPEHQFNPLR